MPVNQTPDPAHLREIIERAAEPVDASEAMRRTRRSTGRRSAMSWVVVSGAAAAGLLAVLVVASRAPEDTGLATGGDGRRPAPATTAPTSTTRAPVTTVVVDPGTAPPAGSVPEGLLVEYDPSGIDPGRPISIWYWVADGASTPGGTGGAGSSAGSTGAWRLVFQHVVGYELIGGKSDGDGKVTNRISVTLPPESLQFLSSGVEVAITNDPCDEPISSCAVAPSFAGETP